MHRRTFGLAASSLLATSAAFLAFPTQPLAQTPAPAPAAASPPAVPGESITPEALAACFDVQAQAAPFTGALLAQRGEVSFSRAFGFRDSAQSEPIGRDTRFRLASVTKMITRTAIARLVDQGRVALDSPVGTYLPELPAAMAAVTIAQLLHHRGGIPSLLRLSELTPEERAAVVDGGTARARVPVIAARPLNFAPGERQSYSNGGYFLLGAVIEAVSGRDYDRFVAGEIFAPLGMRNAGPHIDAATAMPMSFMPDRPGTPRLAQPRPVADRGPSRGSSAGGIIATVDDLALLGKAIGGGEFVSAATADRVFTRGGPGQAIRQNGGNVGMNADFYIFPNGWTLAVLANQDPPAAETMSNALASLIATGNCRTVRPEDLPRPM